MVKNVYNYTSTPQDIYVMHCLIKQKDSFTVFIIYKKKSIFYI
jgi:hypothetical protein